MGRKYRHVVGGISGPAAATSGRLSWHSAISLVFSVFGCLLIASSYVVLARRRQRSANKRPE